MKAQYDLETVTPQEIEWFPEIVDLVAAVQQRIDDDDRATDDPDDDTPAIQLTIASDDSLERWNYQTGDNSYFGGCYGLPHWGVSSVTRDDNPETVAADLVEQILEAVAWN